MTSPDRFDVVAVGLGPFNLALAALLAPHHDVSVRCFEARPSFSWHAGLLLDGTTLQVPFLADLVTMADPTSRFSFLSYLHHHDRLYRFYFREDFFVPRREYDAYCRWVAREVGSVAFDHRVTAVVPDGDGWLVTASGPEGPVTVHAAHVVFGVGTEPALPPAAAAVAATGFDHGGRILHAADYLAHRADLHQMGSVAVVGSGQSAAEVFQDLLEAAAHGGTALRWYTRSSGFFPMEYSKLGLELFTPEYLDHFHGLDPRRRDELRARQDLLYKGISADTSAAIYDRLYEATVDGAPLDVDYRAGCELVALEPITADPDGLGDRASSAGRKGPDGPKGPGEQDGPSTAHRYRLALVHRDTDAPFTVEVEAVVLATGYQPRPLPLASDAIGLDHAGRPVVTRDYRLVSPSGAPLSAFVQNGELHTHGVGTPDLGLGAYRASWIANQVAGRPLYRVPERTVFQAFGAPTGPLATPDPQRRGAPRG